MADLSKAVLTQVGLVVADLDRKVAEYTHLLGLPRPTIVLTDPLEKAHTEYLGRPTKTRAKLAFFALDGITLELIEPDGEPSTWRDFLTAHGEGLHHLGFNVKGMDEIIAGLAKTGIRVVQRGDYEGGRYAYLDAVGQLGFIMELLENY